MPHSPGIGAIFGIVSENGIAKAGGRVSLFDRTTVRLLATTTADSLGGYVFNGLNQASNDYLVMALDDDGSPPKNALVQDYIQPIPAHMGATFPGNWVYQAMSKDPIGIFLGNFVDKIPQGPNPHGTGVLTGDLLPGLASITPGAPHLPSFQFNTGQINAPIKMSGNTNNNFAPNNKFSGEWVLDTTNSAMLVLRRQHTYVHSAVGAPTPGALGLGWDRSTSTFSYAIGVETLQGLYWGLNWWAFTDTTNYASCFTYTNMALNNGVHHVVATVETGFQSKLYIDGALVHTGSLIGQGTNWDSVCCDIALAGWNGANSTNFKCGPFAFYRTVLTAGEVTANYNALMGTTSTPVVSGYIRDLMVDSPGVIVRCNAGTFGTETELLSSDTLTHYGTITVGQTSPVVGGAMTLFGGGVMRGPGPGGPLGRTRGTVEFWVKPNSATPTATGRIITARSDDDATIVWQVSQLITTGRITFNYRKSDGAYETINFVYAPTTAAEVLVAIVLDKSTTGGSAKIYENGVLKDTQVAAYGYFASFQQGDGVPDSGAYINRTMLVGGLRSNAAAITEPFLGKIGEIVTYPYALGVDRLLSHYNARTLI